MLTQHATRNAPSFACLALLVLLLPASAQDFDLVLSSGRVLDPESKLDAVRHIGIRDGVIRAVSETSLRGRTTVDAPRTRMGSLDMGNVSQRVPSIHPYIAIAPSGVPLHSRRFEQFAGGRRGHVGLEVATRALALTALELITNPASLRGARREFREGRRAR